MKDKLKQLHQKARLARDPVATQAYGAALAATQEGEVRENKDFNEAKVLSVIEKEAGKFAESADAFEKAKRPDTAAENRRCSELLSDLLPAKLDPEAYPDLVAKAINETNASSIKDMGSVMAHLKKEHGASLDMKAASAQVKEALQNF